MYQDIKQILISSFQVAEEDFHDEVTLEELGLDSLDLVELSMQLAEFGASVTDDELAEVGRLDAIVGLLETRLTKAS
ncbi:acyl carrier protein [Kitasatospora sp. MAA4]|uniref:acyl carrier protein n=1 Tax=Kitasatospora sp. MAA4 TaxID=3035093 RepID=UPI0024736B28|nr:acyl carrier protein [Kitasatospora sp. MAA4]MDH6135463.1 acyl carrier protein [Kitasatospora sp. MAA4]